MRRTSVPLLLVALLGLLTLLAACGDDGESSSDTTASSTTETTVEVFDPDGGDDADDEPADDDVFDPDAGDDDSGGDSGGGSIDCTIDPEETNEASIIGDWVDCALPELADAVTGANFQNNGGSAEAFVSGQVDEDEALEVCEVTATLFADELTTYEVTITVSTDSDVIGETGTPLAVGTTPGTCEPAA